jgi:uncharacterized protein
MLTADLVRVLRRKGAVTPRYVDPGDPELRATAEALVEVFAEAAEAATPPKRAELDEAVADLIEHKADPLLFRGLVKLLHDRTEFEQAAELDPVSLRAELFAEAARDPMRREPGRPWREKREALVARVAERVGLTPPRLEAVLFADLPANQRLLSHRPMSAEALLDRYNLALAQAVLLRAVHLEVALPPAEVGAYRQVFRELKFRQLIHRVVARPEGGYRIVIDGPLSLFSNATRYGLSMALFLPTLVRLGAWSLEAELRWGKSRDAAIFRLDHSRGLRSTRKDVGQYVTEEQQSFEARFEADPGPWRMSRAACVLQTKEGEVVVPDLVFEHAKDGRRCYLEILGYWRAGSLESRLAALDDPALEGLLLAVSSKLAGEKKAATLEHPRVLWFKQILSSKQVRERLERATPASETMAPGVPA